MDFETCTFIVTLNPDGRITLPPTALSALRWSAGMQLAITRAPDGLTLRLGPLEGER